MRELSDAEVADEIRFIETYQLWPRWPVLPVKHIRRGGPGHPEDEQVAVMVAGRGPKIYLKNMFELKTGLLAEQLEGVRVLEFDSTEDLVRAGWIAD